MAKKASIEYAPVGDVVNNGYDLGGSRFYPFSANLAITPPVYYSNYIGPASGLPVTPPVAAQAGTTGVVQDSILAQATAHPFGKSSPLPWVLAGLVGALAASHYMHYRG